MRIERKDGVIVIHPAEVDDSHGDGDDDRYDDFMKMIMMLR